MVDREIQNNSIARERAPTHTLEDPYVIHLRLTPSTFGEELA
jgi:hypothetical protein